jgi:hypothetical protein
MNGAVAESHYAVIGPRCRGAVLNFNTRLAPAELAHILADAAPRWVIAAAQFQGLLEVAVQCRWVCLGMPSSRSRPRYLQALLIIAIQLLSELICYFIGGIWIRQVVCLAAALGVVMLISVHVWVQEIVPCSMHGKGIAWTVAWRWRVFYG